VSEPAAASLLERLALPRLISERVEARVLVVFDEFQAVLTAQDNVDAIIRSEIQHHADAASYVFAGSHVGMMQQLFTDQRRAFYAQARPLSLPPLPPVPTADYVSERFEATGRSVGRALGPLLDTAAGHPQRTMLLAHHLWERTDPGCSADEDTFARSLASTQVELAEEFVVAWTALGAVERKLLVTLAHSGSPYARSSGTSRGGAVLDALNRLAATGEILKESGQRGRWRIVDPMFLSWLAEGRPD
jgi:hypothetical protein